MKAWHIIHSPPTHNHHHHHQSVDLEIAVVHCRPVSDGGEGHVRKFRQEDFQDEDDDDKMKCTYSGNSTQHQ